MGPKNNNIIIIKFKNGKTTHVQGYGAKAKRKWKQKDGKKMQRNVG